MKCFTVRKLKKKSSGKNPKQNKTDPGATGLGLFFRVRMKLVQIPSRNAEKMSHVLKTTAQSPQDHAFKKQGGQLLRNKIQMHTQTHEHTYTGIPVHTQACTHVNTK